MKRILPILALMILFVGNTFAQNKQRSLEITTGHPGFLHAAEFPWTQAEIEMNWKGQTYTEGPQPGINIGYTYQWTKRWEINTMLNLHLTFMDIHQQPLRPGVEDNGKYGPDTQGRYDWQADPTTTTQVKLYGGLSAAFRYKWIVRDSFSLYSALGAGFSIGLPIPFPYIAPIGIKFGKGKVFGLAEVTLSPANTFVMAGIGIRL
ncbi:MAG: hypothetical protein J6U70_00375 [Bacteroidales bacterium]|nr:hypothetical protein [Bacteroidales bacterium]